MIKSDYIKKKMLPLVIICGVIIFIVCIWGILFYNSFDVVVYRSFGSWDCTIGYDETYSIESNKQTRIVVVNGGDKSKTVGILALESTIFGFEESIYEKDTDFKMGEFIQYNFGTYRGFENRDNPFRIGEVGFDSATYEAHAFVCIKVPLETVLEHYQKPTDFLADIQIYRDYQNGYAIVTVHGQASLLWENSNVRVQFSSNDIIKWLKANKFPTI